MASPDAALTEPERWRDLDMLLTRPGNLVEASFDPSPTVSRRRRLALLHLSLSV
jgi:NEDD8-activating enzyme E1